ncbi:NB-ARC domain-containing protein [Leptolyngbya sp. FACHB-261]|uniref:WD40 domain-containing protein n=1 Tax=Leptolyngbya sp. FACHB-261 TaxID=2692806 RepID=UPI001685B9B2|nr:NB-ARC domain-containing protein [Leptolyngbya sp. FACHB-261]MBD2099307.1 NACHT domain-containing protein [Leptolyngbya sp. FACHB-261]
MTTEEALKIVDSALGKKRLNRVQELVFKHAWEGQAYSEIAASSSYDIHYIKEVGSNLWKLLSEALGEKVTKHNLQAVLRQYAASQAERILSVQTATHSTTQAASPSTPVAYTPRPALSRKCQDWGEAIDVSVFYSRTQELTTLERWLIQDRCRLVTVLGMGGIGKTALAAKLAERVQDEFEYLIWRSLRNAPSIQEMLADLIKFLSLQQAIEPPESVDGKILQLMGYLRKHRCLLILDNAETILCSGERTGRYREGYEGYGQLLRCLAETQHQSCLLLTSREKPKGLAAREGETLPARSLKLTGLSEVAGQQLFKAKGEFSGSAKDWQTLIEHYAGNPLALKIVATNIQEMFDGDVSQFLAQGTTVFGDVWELLDQQFERLSALEQQAMYWLAINREPVSPSDLRNDLATLPSQRELFEVLESLQQRSLIEKAAASFTQQPAVMEYMTERLSREVSEEVIRGSPSLLTRCALIKAQAKDYIRETQIRLILKPVQDRLLAALKNRQKVEEQLTRILNNLRGQPKQQTGYAAGNVLNLLWQLQSDLSGWDFCNLSVWQAYLPHAALRGVSFAHADLKSSVFAETFGGVVSVAFSPDGQLLASSDTSGEIHIWQASNGQQLVACKGHSHWAWAIAFSPDGQWLASAADDYSVKLWDVRTGECLRTYEGHTYSVNTIVFSPDGQMLASSSQDATIRLWNVSAAEPACIRTLQGHEGRVWSLAFSPDGRTLASGSEDLTIKLWDIATGDCCQTWEGHSKWVRSVAFSPDGQRLVSGSYDCTVKLWQVNSGECRQTWQGHSNAVTSVAFNPVGDWVTSSSFDQTLRVWDLQTGQCFRTLQGHSNRIWSVAVSPNGQQLASGGDDHAVKLWDIRTGQCTKTLKGHTNSVLSIALHAEGQTLASGHEDQTVRLWDTETGECLRTLYGHTNRVWAVAFAPQSEMIASGSADRTIKLWNWQTGECLKTLRGHNSWVWAIAFSPDGRHLASGSYDHTIKLWDVESGEYLQTYEGHSSSVVTVAFSADGQQLVSGSFDQMIKLWDLGTGDCIQTLKGHTNSVWSVVFHANGQQLITGSLDHTIKLWDLRTGQCIQTLQGHTAPVMAVACSPDGEQLVSGGFDQKLKFWDLRTGECTKTLHGHTGLISALRFKPACAQSEEAPILLSGSFDQTIRFWDIKTGECLQALRAPRPYEGMNITGVTGLTEAQKVTLIALGAVE